MTVPRVEVHSGQCLLPDGTAIDNNHEVEPPGITLDGAAAPPDRPKPLGDPQVRVRLVERNRVVVRCRVGVGLACAHYNRELVQQLVGGAMQLQRWCADAHIEEGITHHGAVTLPSRLRVTWSTWAAAACRTGDTLVVTKLDRLARSVPDARDIVDELTASGVRLNIGGSIHDRTDPIGRLLFTTLSMIAEFEADLARARTREGMAVARAKGRLRGKQPKLSPSQEAHLVELYRAGGRAISELEELFSVTRSTIYRAIARADSREACP